MAATSYGGEDNRRRPRSASWRERVSLATFGAAALVCLAATVTTDPTRSLELPFVKARLDDTMRDEGRLLFERLHNLRRPDAGHLGGNATKAQAVAPGYIEAPNPAVSWCHMTGPALHECTRDGSASVARAHRPSISLIYA